MAAQFPRISDNRHVSPVGVCCSNEVIIDVFSFYLTKTFPRKLSQVEPQNNINDYPLRINLNQPVSCSS